MNAIHICLLCALLLITIVKIVFIKEKSNPYKNHIKNILLGTLSILFGMLGIYFMNDPNYVMWEIGSLDFFVCAILCMLLVGFGLKEVISSIYKIKQSK